MRMKHSLLNMLVATIPSLILPIVGFVKFSLFSDIYGGSINGLYSTMIQIIGIFKFSGGWFWNCVSTDSLSTVSSKKL